MQRYLWLGCATIICTLGIIAYADNHTEVVPDPPIDLSAYDSEKRRIAQAMTEQAIAAIGLDMDSAIAAIQSADNKLYHDGELFVFVANEDMTIMAHGAHPENVGMNLYNMTDPMGANLGDIFHTAWSPYGTWVEHYVANPDTDGVEKQLVWTKARAGYLYGVGMSQGIEEMHLECEFAVDAPQKQLLGQNIIEQVIMHFSIDKNSALEAILDTDDMTYVDAEVFVMDGDLTMLAHRTIPGAVGANLAGNPIGELIQDNASPYGKWVQYELGSGGKSHVWIKSYSGYMFGVMTACG